MYFVAVEYVFLCFFARKMTKMQHLIGFLIILCVFCWFCLRFCMLFERKRPKIHIAPIPSGRGGHKKTGVIPCLYQKDYFVRSERAFLIPTIDSPIMCFGEQLFHSLLLWENTRHINEQVKQRMTSSSQNTCDCFFGFMVFATEQLP